MADAGREDVSNADDDVTNSAGVVDDVITSVENNDVVENVKSNSAELVKD